MARTDVQLTIAGLEHCAGVAEFYREVWGDASSAESVRDAWSASAASNPVEPNRPAPVILAIQDGRVLGHLGSIPARFWNGTEVLSGYWLKGFMVLPEFRGGPVGYALLREATRQLPRSGALTVAPASRRLFGALGYRDVGCVSNNVRILRGGRVASRIDLNAVGLFAGSGWIRTGVRIAQRTGIAWIGGALLGAGLRVRAAAAGGRGFAAATGLPARDDLDGLWNAGRSGMRAGAVRDGLEFDLRYGALAGAEAEPYHITGVRNAGRLRGVAVLRAPRTDGDPRLAGIALASLSDLWFDPADADAGAATLAAAERLGRSLGADALLCSTSHRLLTGLLRQQGYVRAGGNMHLLFRDTGPSGAGWPESLADWWVSRGDARSDDVF